MKVTFCTYDSPSYLGGPSTWLKRLLPDLRDLGVELEVLFFLDGYAPNNCLCLVDLINHGIACYTFPMKSSTEQKIHWILSQLTDRPPDIFVPHMLVAAFYASRWIKAAGIPTIGVLHSDDEFYRGVLRQFVFGDPAYQLSALVCVSEFLKHQVIHSGNTDIVVEQIACGVPISGKLTQPPTDQFRLIYVGRLEEEQKRISDVTRALCQASNQIPKIEAILFGDGSARLNVEKILQESGQKQNVKLAGVVNSESIQKEMLASHAIVLLSDYEGLPVALMEAMACGLVPICSEMQSGIPELVEDGVTGLLVRDRGESFVAAVRKLRDNSNLWQQLSVAAHHKIVSSFSREACAQKWLALLNQLHTQAQEKKLISIPRFFMLPPVDAGLAWEDRRRFRFAYRQLRHRLGAVKRKILA